MSLESGSDDDGTISFSFTVDQDGEDVPEIQCPKCGQQDCDVFDQGTDTYRCASCGNEFVSSIYQALDSADAYVARARQNLRAWDPKRTIKDCTAAIRLDPGSSPAYVIRGTAHFDTGNSEEAERDYTEALRLSPDIDAAYFGRGKARLALGKFDEAIEDLSASIGFDPEYAQAYELRGVAYFKKGDYNAAVKEFSEAIQRKSDNASAFYQRGYSYSQLGETDKAFDDFNEAIRIKPENPDAYYRRAEMHEKRERYQDAIGDYKNFLRAGGKTSSAAGEVIAKINGLQRQLDPNAEPYMLSSDEDVPIWEDVTLEQDTKEHRSIDRGSELLEKGDLDGAYREFSAFLQHVPDSVPAYIYRSCASYRRGNLEEVIKDLTGAIERGRRIYEDQRNPLETDAGYDKIHLLRASIYALLGKQAETLQDLVDHVRSQLESSYRSSVWSRWTSQRTAPEVAARLFLESATIDPTDPGMHFASGLFAFLRKEPQEALDAIEDAIKADPRHPAYYWGRGICQTEAREAIADYSKAIEQSGAKAEYLFVRGFTKMLSGDTPGGQVDFQEAIGLDPDNCEYHEKLGVFLSRSNHHESAIEHLSKAIELNPDDIDAYYYRGVSHGWRDEIQDALADLQRVVDLEGKPGYVKTEDAQQRMEEISASDQRRTALLSRKDATFKRLKTAEEYVGRGEAHLKAAEWEEAYLDFDEAIRLEPKNAEAYRHRGMASSGMGDAKSAIKDYNQALALDPENSDLFVRRGMLRAKIGETKNAIVDFTDAIRVDPKNQLAYHMRANAHAKSCWFGDSAERAMEDYEEALRLEPNDAGVYVSRATLWAQPVFDGEDKALADCDEAIRLDPKNARARVLRAKIKKSQGDETGAMQDASEAQKLDPGNEEAQELMNELSGTQQPQIPAGEAGAMSVLADLLRQGLRAHGEDRDAEDYRTQGKRNLASKNYEAAIEDFSRAIRLEPENYEAYKWRAMAKARSDHYPEAMEDYTVAIRLNPSEGELRFLRALPQLAVSLTTFDPDGGIEDLASALRLGYDDPKVVELYSDCLVSRFVERFQKGQYQDAIADITARIALGNPRAEYYVDRGMCFANTGEVRAAISDWQTYLQSGGSQDREDVLLEIEKLRKMIDPTRLSSSFPETLAEPKKVEIAKQHIEQGVQLYTNKDTGGALTEYQVAKDIDPTNAQPYEFSFLIYMNSEDWDNAISNLTEVIRIRPDDSDLYFNRGACYSKLGKVEDAIRDTEMAIQLRPDYARAYTNLGALHLTQSQYDLAIEQFDKAIKIDPGVPVAYLYRASAKERKGDRKAAIPDFEKYCELGGSPEMPDLAVLKQHIRELREEDEPGRMQGASEIQTIAQPATEVPVSSAMAEPGPSAPVASEAQAIAEPRADDAVPTTVAEPGPSAPAASEVKTIAEPMTEDAVPTGFAEPSPRPRRRIGTVMIVGAVMVAAAVAAAVFAPMISRETEYRQAGSLLAQQRYEEAVGIYGALDGYKDSSDLMEGAKYLWGIQLMGQQQWDRAITVLFEIDREKYPLVDDLLKTALESRK